MANDQEMSGWTDLLHSSSKLLEQAAPSSQFPPLQRNLDQLEALSKKLKAKTLRNEAPSQSIAATRLLAREGINAEQLARDLKSFELKTTFEDVFPAEATSVEEYLQQVHEMAMVSAIQEAQKDNVRSFNDYMMKVLEEDWRKEKRDFLQSLSRISMLPKTNMIDTSREAHAGQLVPVGSSPRVSSTPGKELVALANIPIHEKKAYVYGEVVKKLNTSRERGMPFRPAMCFKDAYDTLGAEVTRGKSVNMQKIWQLVQAITGEDSAVRQGVSKRMALAIGARHHLQHGHEKFIMDTIQTHPTQAALGGSVGNLQRIRAFLRIRLRDYGVLDFDSTDARRQPPVDTTWQQIYFCLRTGYYEEAREIARSTRSSQQFAPLLTEWITTDGMVAAESAAIASEECEKMLRMGDRLGRTAYDKKKLLLYTIISGSRRQIERILRDLSTLFNTIEDFLWFKLSCIRDVTGGSSSVVLNDGLAPYSLDDLQAYLNKFEPSYYTKNGKDPLVYPYVLLLSVQLLPAIMHLSKEAGDGGYNIDAVHIAISLVDHSVLSEGSGTGHKLSVMDSNAEASSMIRQYGSMFLHHGDLQMTVEYYAQAAATVGGGQLAWSGRSNVDQQRQRNLMLKQLLTEILLRERGIYFLLGARGSGEEGQLGRFFPDSRLRQQFLVEAAHQCQEAGLYDKSIELQKRVGAFSAALETINKCLSETLTLARIASPHSVNKLYQPLFLEGLKDHFQHRRRVINKGDVIAIGIEEGRVRYTASSEGKEESDEFELPASTSTPTAVVHFVVTALSLPSELPPINDKPIDLDEELESGALGCYVDPKVTKLLQSGIEKARVPDDGGWLGLARSPLQTSAASSTSHVTPASRLHDFISAALAPNASSYDLPLTVLVKGARGSGKRTLVYGVARQLGVHVLEIDAYDLLGDTDAKTEGRLQALAVDKALACAPCVLILRNMEALARKSQALETGQEPAMTTVLRESFATIRSGFIDSSQPVIVLGTTTDIDKLPTGVIGLFKEELSIDAPGEPERLAILRNLTKSEHLAPDVALRSLAVQTAALVANDLVDLVRRAKAAAAERVLSLLGPPSADSTGDTVSSAATSTPSSSPTLGDVMNSGFSLTLDDFSKALEAARSSYSESIGAPKIPNVTWDDVGGLANVKSDILDTIQLPLEKPELFADGLKKRSGILLYGPPGTGKTLLAKAVATSCSLNFFSVKGPELLNMYIGESEANVRRVFQRARDAKPCVIFFDELDSVAPKRGNQGDSGGVMDRIVSQLLAELDGMSEGKGGNDVFVIGATNRPDLLDPALLRPGRFDRMLYLGISETHQAQLKIIEALTRKFKLEPEIRLDLVAEQCPYNYTGADFYALCSDAMLKAMSRKAEDIDRKIADLNSRPPYSNGQTAPLTPQYYLAEMATPAEIEVLVAQQDFEAALAELIPSVSPQELSHYKQVRAKFSTETMNSDDKMEKKNLQQNGSVKDLIEKSRPLREKGNGLVNGNGGGIPEEESEDGEEEEERKRKSLAKGKGKAREQ